MKTMLAAILLGVTTLSSRADPMPAVGVLEIVPVVGRDFKVTSRPVYIFTNQKLSIPTTFTGLQAGGALLSVVCCFKVTNLTPVSLEKIVSRYAPDDDNAREHLRSIEGYGFVYAAEPIGDKHHWTSTMQLLAHNATDPTDASPFSAAAVGALVSGEEIPATFNANGSAVTVATRFDKNTGRVIYTFVRDTRKLVFSESTFPH
jgi:hypothetical protein